MSSAERKPAIVPWKDAALIRRSMAPDVPRMAHQRRSRRSGFFLFQPWCEKFHGMHAFPGPRHVAQRFGTPQRGCAGQPARRQGTPRPKPQLRRRAARRLEISPGMARARKKAKRAAYLPILQIILAAGHQAGDAVVGEALFKEIELAMRGGRAQPSRKRQRISPSVAEAASMSTPPARRATSLATHTASEKAVSARTRRTGAPSWMAGRRERAGPGLWAMHFSARRSMSGAER